MKIFYLFIFRKRGREGERERNINVWLPLTCPELGTQPTTQACAVTGNRTCNPLVLRSSLNPRSHSSQGSIVCFNEPPPPPATRRLCGSACRKISVAVHFRRGRREVSRGGGCGAQARLQPLVLPSLWGHGGDSYPGRCATTRGPPPPELWCPVLTGSLSQRHRRAAPRPPMVDLGLRPLQRKGCPVWPRPPSASLAETLSLAHSPRWQTLYQAGRPQAERLPPGAGPGPDLSWAEPAVGCGHPRSAELTLHSHLGRRRRRRRRGRRRQVCKQKHQGLLW